MKSEPRVGGHVRIVIALMGPAKPGDTGTVVLATRIADGKVMDHVLMDPPSSAGLVSFYPHEIEPAQ
jgi:hypothetical protein